jgi:peptidoglycan/xylan/chitin deacetylase (PgdA/CDA1 family)
MVQDDHEHFEKIFTIVDDNTYRIMSKIDGYEVYFHLNERVLLDEAKYKIPFDVINMANGNNEGSHLIFELKENKTGLLLSFDDGHRSWVDNADIFASYPYVQCTFFISSYRDDMPERKDIARFFYRKGYEIGNHTTHHYSLPSLSSIEEFEDETLTSYNLMKNDGMEIVSFAYPGGGYDPWMNEELEKTYKFIRGFGSRIHIYTVEEMKKGGYSSTKSIDYKLYLSSDKFRKNIDNMLMLVKFLGDGYVLPLTTHIISTTDTGYAIRPADLTYLFKTATDMKMAFYSYRDFLDR